MKYLKLEKPLATYVKDVIGLTLELKSVLANKLSLIDVGVYYKEGYTKPTTLDIVTQEGYIFTFPFSYVFTDKELKNIANLTLHFYYWKECSDSDDEHIKQSVKRFNLMMEGVLKGYPRIRQSILMGEIDFSNYLIQQSYAGTVPYNLEGKDISEVIPKTVESIDYYYRLEGLTFASKQGVDGGKGHTEITVKYIVELKNDDMKYLEQMFIELKDNLELEVDYLELAFKDKNIVLKIPVTSTYDVLLQSIEVAEAHLKLQKNALLLKGYRDNEEKHIQMEYNYTLE